MADWRNRIVKHAEVNPGELTPNPLNWRAHPKQQADALAGLIETVGWVDDVIVNVTTGNILDGHLRVKLAQERGEPTVPVKYVELSEDEENLVLASFDPITGLAEMDAQALAELLGRVDMQAIEDDGLAGLLEELATASGANAPGEPVDAEPQVDRAEELRQKWGVEPGDLWLLDSGKGHAHRLICGDCTDADVVGRVMDGEKAVLCHADPPYGMGKENEGIANDNLYREKLDGFQMQWWSACRPVLADNASVYIWGNAQDLWRLWYVGGLRDSERLTFRNEIVWDKGGGGFGVGTEQLRSYFPEERCLFFMLGEQGFNNNADNYWQGWEPIRAYLDGERQKMGWSIKEASEACGTSGMAKHYFTISQWEMPSRERYELLQKSARGDAFKREYDAFKREYDDLKREYDDLKREFYATRAYFDNAHDNMTDVWRFNRLHNDDRYGHATPKPVEMVARAIMSSAPNGGVVYVPFGGTLPEVIAAENLGRRCYACEIDAGYVGVALERFFQSTGSAPVRIENAPAIAAEAVGV